MLGYLKYAGDLYGSVLKVSAVKEKNRHGVAGMLKELQEARGADYIELLKKIIDSREFKPIPGEHGIFAMPSSSERKEYENLLEAARKAVGLGYKVYVMPNPKDIVSMDFIFERKGVVKAYDLKTISGKNSLDNRLYDSVRQSNRVIANIIADISPRFIAKTIKRHFENNPEAVEVLILKGKRVIVVQRDYAAHKRFELDFLQDWQK